MTASVRLYTRHGCHLCEEVEAQLAALAPVWPHELTTIDIDSTPELRRRYGQVMPVVVVERAWVLVARIDRALLTEAFALARRGKR